jgi:hypothetical protein
LAAPGVADCLAGIVAVAGGRADDGANSGEPVGFQSDPKQTVTLRDVVVGWSSIASLSDTATVSLPAVAS